MFFELQLSSNTLGRIVGNHLRQIGLCVEDPFILQGDTVMVDRILILSSSSLKAQPHSFNVNVNGISQTVHGSMAVLMQPLQFELVKVQDVIANGENPTAAFVKPVLTALLDITAFVKNGNAILQIAYRDIDYGIYAPLIDDDTKKRIHVRIKSKMQPFAQQLDIGKIRSIVPSVPLVVTNAGATTKGSGSNLIVRIEFDGAPNQAATWNDFFANYARNLVGDRDWAVLIDKDMLIQSIHNKLSGQLAGSADKFALHGGVGVLWAHMPGPVFNVNFSGEVIDACTCAWGELDLNVDISTSITLQATRGSVTRGSVIRTHAYTTYNADDLEVFCCALTGALLWPVIGPIYMGNDRINFLEFLLGLLTAPVGPFIAICVFAGNRDITSYLPLDAECRKIDDKTIECDRPFSFDMGDFGGRFDLTNIEGQPDGPVFSGKSITTDFNDPKLSMSSEGFGWYPGGTCSSGWGVHLGASLTCSLDAERPSVLKVCSASAFDDPLRIFENIKIIEADPSDIVIVPQLTDDYLADPYPCKLRVISNGGIRILTLAAPKVLSNEEFIALQLEAKVLGDGHCLIPVNWNTPILWRGPWPDPPAPKLDMAQLWQVVISELLTDESVDLVDQANRVVATSTPNSRGTAQVSYWSERPIEELGVRVNSGIKMNDLGSATSDDNIRRISVKQTQLVPLSRVAVTGNFHRLTVEQLGNQITLSVQTSVGETMYDITVPGFPSFVSEDVFDTSGKRGLYKQPGLKITDTGREISLENDEGEVLLSIAHAVPASIAVLKEYLFIGRENSIEAYNLSSRALSQKTVLSQLTIEDIVQIQPARIVGVNRALGVIDRTGVSKIVDVSDLTKVKEIGHYFHKPWFVEADRKGKIFAKLSSDGGHIQIYAIDKVIDV